MGVKGGIFYIDGDLVKEINKVKHNEPSISVSDALRTLMKKRKGNKFENWQ